MVLDAGSAILSEIVVIIGVALVVYIIFKLGKFFIGLLANIVLGFISIFIINYFFNLGILWNIWVVIITAVLGLPGVAIIVILRLLGVSI